MRSTVTQQSLSAHEIGKASKLKKSKGKRVTPGALSKNHSQIQIGNQKVTQPNVDPSRPRSRSGTNQKNMSTFDFHQTAAIGDQEARNAGKKYIEP